MSERVEELFVNYNMLAEYIENGVYIPALYKPYNVSNLKACIIMKHAIELFKLSEEYELCNMFKEQIDVFFRVIDVSESETIDFSKEINSVGIEICPIDISEAVDVLYADIFTSGKYEDIDSLEMLSEPIDLLVARLFTNFAPIIIQGFALDDGLKDVNPIMLEFANEGIDNVRMMAYEIIKRAVEKFLVLDIEN